MLAVNESFICSPGITLYNIKWLRDEHGEYWVANFKDANSSGGVTGSYYSIGDNGMRQSRKEQEEELRRCGHI